MASVTMGSTFVALQRIVRLYSIEEIGKQRSLAKRTRKANRHTGQRQGYSHLNGDIRRFNFLHRQRTSS